MLDLRKVTPIADYFVICSVTSERHLDTLVEEVAKETKERLHVRPWHVEGTSQDGWVLLDYGNVVVHAFMPAVRSYYDLEGLWREASVVVNIL